MIVEEFCEDEINNQAYVVVGVRGSGKTVFLTEAAKEISSRKDWIVIDLNAERNLLEDFVSALNSRKPLSKIFREAKINLSMLGFGLEIQDAAPIANIQEAARQMLLSLKKHGKRVLVTVGQLPTT
jgi:chromosomal replication initiation ATPase DnaA